MNTIKRILITALALLLSASLLVACDAQGAGASESEKSTGAATEAPKLEDFDYTSADIDSLISISPSDYRELTITLSTSYEVSDSNVQKYIDEILKKNPQPVKIVDRAVQSGDTVYIYYEGLLNGVAFQGGTHAETETSEPYALKIGSGAFIPGFEDGLIGVIPSETSKDDPIALPLTFPENYKNNPDLAGKAVVFNVYIEYISNETFVPEYNADTVTAILGFKAEGENVLDEFETYIKGILENERDSAALSEIMKLITNAAKIKSFPEESVNFWYQYYLSQIQQNVDMYQMYGMEVTLDEMACQMLGLKAGSDWQTPLTEMAKDVVKSILVYYGVAENEGLTVTDAEYVEKLRELADYYSSAEKTYTPEEIEKEIGKSTLMQNILMGKVDKYLMEHCTIEYKDK